MCTASKLWLRIDTKDRDGRRLDWMGGVLKRNNARGDVGPRMVGVIEVIRTVIFLWEMRMTIGSQAVG